MIDLLIGLLILISFISGWRAGFLRSIFSLLGFVGGGLLGLITGIKFLSGVTNIFGKFALYILFISIGSTLGEWVFQKFAKFFHEKVLFAPFKWIDSILGAAFIIARNILILYLVFSLVVLAGWSWPSKYINQSKLYLKTEKLIPNLFKGTMAKVKF